MQYILMFLEGIITFISPCLLSMLPIYISYFAANEANKKKALTNSIGFVLGFTIVFVIMGAFMGTVGKLIRNYKTILNIVTGSIVIIIGLNFLGILKIGFLNRIGKKNMVIKNLEFFSSMVFGIVFSINWTPCVGTFLGSALLMASLEGSLLKGISMLFAFSLGLGIPFIISALLIDQLKGAFDFIEKNYKIINFISGGLLIIVGILMATGYIGYFFSLLTF
ncbi:MULTISPECIES: cytochrome c biogenesis CcdA family protein [Tissierellales]|uniref:Cytochrome c biogenesis protein CcdA n=1 Tax=Acidilutibacter cellobiosedens TaxID=2507161 RepID=A0A410Q878_9FIRM|nr:MULTISPECIES: cytochrome c biogenesis protein CcdA [Tissierellales]MBE6083289.1 cytochrome c biogenesis protein CcdA [Tissierellaceae bacterium]QAT60190.1 cytochrome c biogenesis protein CcdA [Acidilutibacter cellobiosedens]SCL92554.1 thiol:disulfide interchange protein precursor [Sporanaerobacter sp. PP17-6a]